jgi:hypothetical protein
VFFFLPLNKYFLIEKSPKLMSKNYQKI